VIGFFEADIDYPDCYLPALPALFSNKLFFPVGSFKGIFSSIELREAISSGAAVKINSGVIFQSETIFDTFVLNLYEMRMKAKKEKNHALDYACKFILNSLYGKFGQGREQACYLLDPGTPRLDMDELDSPIIWPLPDGLAFYMRECHAAHLLPHISATVTSRARTITLAYLREAGKVWYSDTDSIFTPSRLSVSNTLGGLKKVKRGVFQAYGLKEYRFDNHYSLKGVSIKKEDPKTGKKIEDPAIAERYLHGDKIEFSRRAGFIESIRKGLPTLRRIDTFKQRHKRIEKRARIQESSDTRPWTAREIEGMI
jgi:hypothetical protein